MQAKVRCRIFLDNMMEDTGRIEQRNGSTERMEKMKTQGNGEKAR